MLTMQQPRLATASHLCRAPGLRHLLRCTGRCTQRTARARQPPHRMVRADAAPAWTLDQIAGLAFGGLMIAAYFSAGKIDEFIAREQRRELGLCEACGGVYDPQTCTQQGCPKRGKSAASPGSSNSRG